MLEFENEDWKPVKNFEWLYLISNYGRIKSLRNLIEVAPWKLEPKILSAKVTDYGYFKYTLVKSGKLHYVLGHRLVAEVFIPNPNNLPIINHKDGNKSNNHSSNLEWCTQADNIRHAYRTGLKEGSKGESNALSKLSSDQVQAIDYLLKQGVLDQTQIAREFDIDSVTVTNIKQGKTWWWLTGRDRKETKKELKHEVVKQIFDMAIEGKVYQKDIAKQFGISQTHVSEIKSGKMWPEFRKDYDEQLAQKVL